MFGKLIDFAKKVNKWYVWLIVAFVIASVIALQALGFTSCQSVKVVSESSSVSVDGRFDIDPQTAVETRLNDQFKQSIE